MSGNDFEGFGRPDAAKPREGENQPDTSGHTFGQNGFGARFGQPHVEPGEPNDSDRSTDTAEADQPPAAAAPPATPWGQDDGQHDTGVLPTAGPQHTEVLGTAPGPAAAPQWGAPPAPESGQSYEAGQSYGDGQSYGGQAPAPSYGSTAPGAPSYGGPSPSPSYEPQSPQNGAGPQSGQGGPSYGGAAAVAGVGAGVGAAAYGAQQAGTPNGFGQPGPGGPGYPQGPGRGGPGGPVGSNGPDARGGRKPWFRRPAILIPAIIGVVAVVTAAIAIPVTIHNNNVTKGNELAAQFSSDLDDHYGVWTDEGLDTAANVVISESLGENADFFSQTATNMSDFSARCGNVTAAATQIEELAGSTVPTLTVEDGADASEEFKAAQTESDGLGDRRDIVSNFSDTASADIASLKQFCDAFPQYNSLYNAYGVDLTTTLPSVFTLTNGQTINLPNNLTFTCTNAAGCPDYTDAQVGVKLGDAIQSTYVDFYRGIADLATNSCFLDDLSAVCTSYSTEFGKAADAAQQVADSFRTEPMTLAAGSSPFPNSAPLYEAMFTTFDTTDTAVQTAWWSADPTVDGQTDRGWQARSLKAFLATHESSIATLVESVRQ